MFLLDEIAQGQHIDESEYLATKAGVRDLASRFDAMMEKFGALLTPAMLGEAPRGLEMPGDATFYLNWTLIGFSRAVLALSLNESAYSDELPSDVWSSVSRVSSPSRSGDEVRSPSGRWSAPYRAPTPPPRSEWRNSWREGRSPDVGSGPANPCRACGSSPSKSIYL
jgi:hypothetical protein